MSNFLRLSFLLLTGLAACSSPEPTSPEAPGTGPDPAAPAAIRATLEADALTAGQAVFAERCAVCHGPDGRQGTNGAHDLTKSNLNVTGRVYMVTNGFGKMPGFKDQLTEEQIQQVAAYSLTLR